MAKNKMTFECENGHVYEISKSAVNALEYCYNARTANDAFEGFASNVPEWDRLGVWNAVSEMFSNIK